VLLNQQRGGRMGCSTRCSASSEPRSRQVARRFPRHRRGLEHDSQARGSGRARTISRPAGARPTSGSPSPRWRHDRARPGAPAHALTSWTTTNAISPARQTR
jgi:hypothetical protein